MIVWHRDWYEQFDPGHVGEMLRSIRAKRLARTADVVPADWHPHDLRDKPPEDAPSEAALRADARMRAMLADRPPTAAASE